MRGYATAPVQRAVVASRQGGAEAVALLSPSLQKTFRSAPEMNQVKSKLVGTFPASSYNALWTESAVVGPSRNDINSPHVRAARASSILTC